MKVWLAAIAFALMVTAFACSDASVRRQSTERTGPCPTQTQQTADDDAPASVADLVDRMAEALTCPEQVAHIIVSVESDRGGESHSGQGEYWLDMSRAVAREAPADQPGLIEPGGRIIRDDGVYYADSDGEPEREPPPSCLGEDLVPLAALIDIECMFLGSGAFDIQIDQDASLEGQPAISAEAAGYFPGGPDEDDLVDLTYTLYVDSDTYLPLGTVLDYTYVYGPPVGERTETTFDVTFVPASMVASDFFEPRSVGYVEPNPLAELDALDGEIYWLGEKLAGSDDLPALALDGVWSPAGLAEDLREDNTYVGIVYYRDADDPFGTQVALHEYESDPASEAYFKEPSLTSGECLAERRDVELVEGDAFIYGVAHNRGSSQCGEATHYVARAFFDDSHVTIIVSENTNHPFDSAEAMEHLLRGLRRRN